MMTRADKFQRWLEDLQPREKWTLVLMVVVVLVVFWDAVFRQPMVKQLGQLNSQRNALAAEIEGYDRALAIIAENEESPSDPVADAQARIVELQAELRELDEQAASLTSSGVVTPGEMSVALKEILALNQSLRLVSLRNLPAEPVMTPAESLLGRVVGDSGGPKLYRHSVELVFEGSYLDALAYTQSLEQLTWRLIWDQIELKTLAYPQARIRLLISTLSLRAGLVGV